MSNGTMRIVSNTYSPVHGVDPDASGRPNAGLDPIPDTGLDVADDGERDTEEVPPSYDESNRMNPITVPR